MVGGVATPHAEPLLLESFLWGLLSASSLNIGSLIGVTCLPSQKIRAMFMAFGGGALLFALSVELFGHTLHRYEQNHETSVVWTMEGSAVFGGLLFALLNRVLNGAGADVRKPSTRMGTMARMRGLLMRRLTSRLSKVHLFSKLTYDELSQLIQKAMYMERFGAGDSIMSQSQDHGIYFVISGAVRLQFLEGEKQDPEAQPRKDRAIDVHAQADHMPHINRLDDAKADHMPHIICLDDEPSEVRVEVSDDNDEASASSPESDESMHSWDLGPNQIFGDMRVLTGSHIDAEVHALRHTKVLVFPHHEVLHLLKNNSAVREFVSSGAVEQLKQVPELNHLPDHSLAMLSARCPHQQFKPGAVVFRGVVDDRTPLICVVLGSVARNFAKTGAKDVLKSGSLLCTEHLKGSTSMPFTATAVVQTTVLFLQRHVLDEVSKMSIMRPGDRVGWKSFIGAVQDKAQNSHNLGRWHASSRPDDVLSSITDEELAESVNSDFDEAPLDPWVAAMMQYMQGVHERVVTDKSLHKREQRMQSEAVVEKRVGDLKDRAIKAKRANGEKSAQKDDKKRAADRPEKPKTDGRAPEQRLIVKPKDEHVSAHVAKKTDVRGPEHGKPTYEHEFAEEAGGHAKGSEAKHTAIMVWMGILIDAIPESLVIGILVNKSAISDASSASMALPFVMSVFLSNLPEAMSSSGSMKSHGMSVCQITLMWFMTTFVTAFGALIGAVLFPPDTIASHNTEVIVSAVEGVAAGAMLTMIAQTMMPEAFEQGGDIVGLSCLAGFLCAMSVKLIPT